MEQLVLGKTAAGNYYVRPLNWAGAWDKQGRLRAGNTLFESADETECHIFIEECSSEASKFEIINEVLTDNTELKRLLTENPDLPIMFLCGEESYSDDFGYTVNVGSFQIEEVTMIDDRICDDETELEEEIYTKLEKKYPDVSKKLLDAITEKMLSEYKWQKVISARIG